MSKKINFSFNIGFFGLLAILFITLKLIGIIDWAWIWVLSPIWGPLVLFLVFFVVFFIIFFVLQEIVDRRNAKRRSKIKKTN
jgi:divalent metal cation (Fe/Co/Zn/Cd) transporter